MHASGRVRRSPRGRTARSPRRDRAQSAASPVTALARRSSPADARARSTMPLSTDLHHVVDRQRGDARRDHRLHLDAGLAHSSSRVRLDLAARLARPTRTHVDRVERQRMRRAGSTRRFAWPRRCRRSARRRTRRPSAASPSRSAVGRSRRQAHERARARAFAASTAFAPTSTIVDASRRPRRARAARRAHRAARAD